MPNWCSNHMTVSGDAARVAELAEKIVRPHPDKPAEMTFDFNGICPMPEDLLNVSSICSQDEICWGGLNESRTMPQIAGAISDGFYQKLKAELEKTFDWQKLTVGHVNRWLNDVCPDLQCSLGLNPEAARKTAYNIKHHGAPGWYDWRIRHWGTKWNADCCYISRSDGLLEISFETAWSPPDGVYRAICAAYPDLELVGKYIEDGMCFAGYYDNIGPDLYDNPCADEDYRKFGIEHFGYEYEDENDEDE
ncbi:hypothetical protein [Neisseria sp. S1]|uniref:DUF1281 family ferredoxin-like fold protein n=1 Tax=Neisseria sp. S1 TaxID=3318354 RepID=UPI003A85628E